MSEISPHLLSGNRFESHPALPSLCCGGITSSDGFEFSFKSAYNGANRQVRTLVLQSQTCWKQTQIPIRIGKAHFEKGDASSMILTL